MTSKGSNSSGVTTTDNNEMNDEIISDKFNISEDTASIKSTDAVHETHHENLDDLPQTTDSNPIEETPQPSQLELEQQEKPQLHRYMAACQAGDLNIVQELVNSGEINPTETFSDEVTGLHWAALNDRSSIVKYLCENPVQKCNPNAIGGELRASPLHWAARNGNTNTVHYLLQNTSADPSLRDIQSYNVLHLAVHSSNILVVIYVVLQCCLQDSQKKLYIDEPDSSNRTALHWAAYQGDLFTINCLLKFGADASKVDNALFIPLHWGFMRGHKIVLKQLLEAGSDIWMKNDKGKNSFEVAKDMNCYATWIQVLKEAGYLELNGFVYKASLLDPKTAKLITFFVPYFMLPIVWNLCSFSKGYIIPKIFLSAVFLVGTVGGLNRFVIASYCRESKAIAKSPLMAGIFSSALVWCAIVWCYNVVSTTFFKTFFSNFLLGVIFAIIGGTFYKAMFMNPGFVPTPSNNSVILELVVTLIEEGNYSISTFSIDSYVRKPLRLKYSRPSKQLVARFDHYCPWIYNDVGVRNHKLFLTFVYALIIGIILFTKVSLKFFHEYEGGPNSGYDSDNEESQCFLLSGDLCLGYTYNSFHFNLVIFALLQLVWVLFLAMTQTFQILKGLTTYEFTNIGRGSSFANPGEPHQHNHGNGCSMILKLLGLDQLGVTLKVSGSLVGEDTSQGDIPSDYGWKINWLDFWILGDLNWRNIFYLPIEGENNLGGQLVDYYKLYEYPPKTAAQVV